MKWVAGTQAWARGVIWKEGWCWRPWEWKQRPRTKVRAEVEKQRRHCGARSEGWVWVWQKEGQSLGEWYHKNTSQSVGKSIGAVVGIVRRPGGDLGYTLEV
jgi:hypothetical protein